jgi:uncharacterized protein (TIGR00299 family) protein
MKYIYIDGCSGLSGDMFLGALLDLDISPDLFKKKMAQLKLPVEVHVDETSRASLRGLEVNVRVTGKPSKPRKWNDIKDIINNSPFSSLVRKNSLDIFKRLFDAESRVHKKRFEEAHLHEAGADDAIIDVVGTCYLAESLNIKKFYASPLNVGRGWVKSAHGVLPVPPPAVAELLKDIPVYSAWVEEELITPTGAAIVSTLAEEFLSFPELCYEKIGYGAGARDFPDFPNILRIFYGNAKEMKAGKNVLQVETNIDDANPQVLASFLNKALQRGALDAFLTPVFMKKNRLGTKLTLLVETDKIDEILKAVFEETTSIGVRYFPVSRRVLKRKTFFVSVLGKKIPVKIAYQDGNEVNVHPEFSACLKIAEKSGKPVKEIIQRVLTQYAQQKKTS